MKQLRSEAEEARIAAEVAAVATLGREQLKQRWRSLYGSEPPLRMSQDLLRRAVAYRLQERVLGGLDPSVRRLLARVAERDLSKGQGAGAAGNAVPGAVLIREWRGTSHQVRVLEDGVLFGGRRYRSLSAVARHITGTRWSGPRFFGLRAAAQEHHDGAR